MDKVVTSTPGVNSNTKRAWATFKATWSEYGNGFKTMASFWPVLDDARVLGALALELKRGGSILAKYKVVTYSNKSFVLLHSEPALRKHLTRNVFAANSPKVVNLGIGKLGALNAIRSGAIFTVIFSAAFHAFDQLMRDEITWHHFVGGFAVDVVLAATASGIAWAGVATVVGTGAMIALGPMVAVVFVGGLLFFGFDYISREYQLVDRVVLLLQEAEQRNKDSVARMEWEVKKLLTDKEEDPVGFWHRLFGVPQFNKENDGRINAIRGR